MLSDKQNGPVSHDEIINQIKQNIIHHSTLLWKDGMVDWVEASSIDAHGNTYTVSLVDVDAPSVGVSLDIDPPRVSTLVLPPCSSYSIH